MQLFCIIPIENAFVTFSTPEKAYSYSESGITRLAINGEKTVFIVGESGDKDVYIIMPKSRDGYKLGFKFFQKTLLYNYNSAIVNIYQYKEMGDYYISVTDISGENFEITDNHNSEFYCLEKDQSYSNKTIYSYYAYIGDFDEQYTVIVNGQEIQF